MPDKNVNKDIDKDLNLDFVDDDLRDVGIFFIFARYIFPFIAGLIVLLILIGLGWLLLNTLDIDFPDAAPIGAIVLLLAVIIILSAKV